MGMQHEVGIAATMGSLSSGAAALATAGPDPFSGVAQSVTQNVANWAGLMAILAALVVAGVAYFGSSNTGRWIGRFIVGTLFVVLATMSTGLLPWLRSLFNVN
jgi:hypothetical protein